MAEESTRDPGAADRGDEPTTPVTPDANAPWTPPSTPDAGWSRSPADTQPIPAGMDAATQPTEQIPQTFASPVPGQPGTAPLASAGGPGYPGAAYPQPGGGYPQPGAGYPQPGGYASYTQAPSAPTGGQAYPPYGTGPYSQSGYGYYNGAYPPPGGYPPGQPQPGPYGAYYAPQHQVAQPQKKQRWPLALVALMLAFALGVAGYAVAGGRIGAAPRPHITTAPQFPGAGQEPSQEGSDQGTTQSSSVSEAQAKGVALIEAATAEGTAYGTGMVLSPDGKVLTNYHVVAGTTKVVVTIATTGDSYAATVLGFDQTKDVALLQLKNASGLDTVTLDNNPVSVGDAVAAVGNASGGMKLIKAGGKVTGTDQALQVNSESPWGNTEDLSGLVATNAGAVPGDSGGPMFDSQNEVLGMTTAGSTKEHTSYAIPIATAVAVVNQIEAGQDAGTVRVGPAGYLGVRVADSSYTGSGGSTVASVVAGGPAAKAGIAAGSRITKVGDTDITAKTNVAAVIRALEPGQQTEVWWTTSGGAHKHATVTIGSSPVN